MPVLAVLVSFAVLGLVALVVAGRAGPGVVDVPPDGVALTLPEGRAMTDDDVRRVGFAMALRGYRMAEVDAVLARLASEIGERDALIARLTAHSDEAVGGPSMDDDPGSEPVPAEPAPVTAPGVGTPGDGSVAGTGDRGEQS